MTVERLKNYARKRGYFFDGKQNYRGFYRADRNDGSWVTSDTLMGLKRMIDRNC